MTAGLRAGGHRHLSGWRPRLAHSCNWERRHCNFEPYEWTDTSLLDRAC
ncbi:hypothetical protein ABIG06_006145 [Bradyrhizobium sp. USDA 326]